MTCFVSFVVAGRNDDYGGNFLARVQTFITLLAHQLDACGVDGELVLVEWNPPKDKPLLKDVLAWPKTLQARIFVAGEEVHNKLPNPREVPMYEYIARNVGIRRAKGEYILATNPDVVYNTRLAGFLTPDKLEMGRFYRVDRYSVSEPLPPISDPREILAFCASHFSRVDLRGGTVKVPFHTAGRIGQAGWEIERQLHEVQSHALRPFRLEDALYTNASGCFMLMNRKHWFDLRGFPQMPTVLHCDAYLVSEAASVGLRQVQLPPSMRMYHLDHGRTWPHSPDAEAVYARWARDTREMLSSKKPMITNDENWGFADLELAEYSGDPRGR